MTMNVLTAALFCFLTAFTMSGQSFGIDAQEKADLLELTLIGKVVMTEQIDLNGPDYTSIPQSAGEGKTFLVIDAQMKFSRTDVAVFFDQVALFTADAEKVSPSYFAVSYDPTKKTYAPAFVAGEGKGGFMKKVPGGMKLAFTYVSTTDEKSGKQRWGLAYEKENENTVFIFEVNKTDVCVLFTISDKAIELLNK